MEAERAKKEDEQHGKRLSILPKRHSGGSRVGKEWGKWVPQSCRKSTVHALLLDLQKEFETHYTITYPDALPLDFSDEECCSTGNIVGKQNRLRSDSPVSSAHFSLQRQILRISQELQNKQDSQRFLLVSTVKRLDLPKAGGRAAGCFPPFKNTYSG